jgi:hypothetical protein
MQPLSQRLLNGAAVAVMMLSGVAAQTTTHNATTKFSDPSGPYTTEQLASIKFPDLDGDGFADMCYIDASGVQCALSRGTGKFSNFVQWTDAFRLGLTDQSMWGTIQYGDVDNDGKDDICGRTSSGFICLFSDGESSFINQYTKAFKFGGTEWQAPQYWSTIRLVDVSGDGKLDVCGRSAIGIVCEILQVIPEAGGATKVFGGWSQWDTQFSDAKGWAADPSYWSTIQFADVNGDGRKDVCGRFDDGIWCELNYGSKFDGYTHMETDFSNVDGWNQPQYYSTIRFADINGDAKADVCARGSFGLICGLSTGGQYPSFAGTLAPPVKTGFSDANGWNQNYRFKNMWMVNTNRDSRADVCGRASNGIICAVSTSQNSDLQFGPTALFVSGFADTDEGIQTPSAFTYWSTLQPGKNGFGRPVGFCGRESLGISCSN